jgi:type VI secretion system protein
VHRDVVQTRPLPSKDRPHLGPVLRFHREETAPLYGIARRDRRPPLETLTRPGWFPFVSCTLDIEGAYLVPTIFSLASAVEWVNTQFGSTSSGDPQPSVYSAAVLMYRRIRVFFLMLRATADEFGAGFPALSARLTTPDRTMQQEKSLSFRQEPTVSPHRHLVVLSLMAAALLVGCALKHPVKSLKQATGHPPTVVLQVQLSADANGDSVVPFDVVVVQNKTLLKTVSQMDAATWFGPKGRCNYRGGPKAKIQFHSWEFVPGQTFRIDLPVTADSIAVLGFANYSTPGTHRVDFVTSGSQFVDMGEDGVHVLKTVPVPSSTQPSAPEMRKVCPDD